MSFALSSALQAAVYTRLVGDAEIAALVGPHVFDALPAGPVPSLYVVLGAEKVRDASDQGGAGAWHDFGVLVVSDSAGFAASKSVAGAVCDALIDAPLSLVRGRLVSLRFRKAAASRVGTGDTRRIDLTFRARVSDE